MISSTATIASAASFEDIPDALGDVLGVTSTTAKAILSGLLVFAIVLPLALAKMDMLPMFAVLILMIAILVAIGWLPLWIILVIALLAAAMVASMIRTGVAS
jgi:hypothetical protein